MKTSIALVLFLVSASLAAETADRAVRREIDHLFSFLTGSGCRFERNGSWYSATDAAEHLRKKYEYLLKKDLLPNTEAFIDRAATRSSMSGKAYRLQCADGKISESGPWFRAELERYRKARK